VCGRFLQVADAQALADFFEASPPDVDLGANHNVAPTQEIYGVIASPSGSRQLRVFEWGLIPTWASDASRRASLINARAETVRTKPAFSDSFLRRRCLVPMSGFYEWLPADASVTALKQPVLIERVDHDPIAAAGLWSAWRPRGSGDNSAWHHTCTVITTASNHTLRAVHDRMPVVLERAEWETWLNPATPADQLEALLNPAPESSLTFCRVSPEVNSVRNRGPFERL